MSMFHLFDDRICTLGEGPLWHPERGQLFWFDIIEKRLMTRTAEGPQHWQFDEHVSAAGWIDRSTLLIASETALIRFDIETGTQEIITPLEADTPATRSNDGRADPWGGFWIGTMGKNAEEGAGAIYRYYRGELRRLFHDITIPNAICFGPDRDRAYFTDTGTGLIMRQDLDAENGWPTGDPEVWRDFSYKKWGVDGAVIDAEGNMWNAQWGGGRIASYGPDGAFLEVHDVPARQVSCPAFGGADLTTLYVTSATQGLTQAQLDALPDSGKVFALHGVAQGQAEHQVIL